MTEQAAQQEAATGAAPEEPPVDMVAAAHEEAREAILAEARGEEPPAKEPEEEPIGEAEAEAAAAEQEQGTAPAEAAAAEQEAEPEIDWGALPPEAKAAFDAAQARAAKAEHQFKSREGREAALQRRLDAVMAGEGEKPGQPAKPSEQDGSEFVRELSALASDYPEIAQPIAKGFARLENIISRQAETITRLEAGLQTVGEDRLDAASAAAEAIVKETHPDYEDIAGSDAFAEWVEGQSDAMRALILPNAEFVTNADDVTFVLDRYKRDKGIQTDGATAGNGKTQPTADATRAARRRSAAAPLRSSPGAAVSEAGGGYKTVEQAREEILAEARRQMAAEA